MAGHRARGARFRTAWCWVGVAWAAGGTAAPVPRDCRSPRLTIRASPSRPGQGGVVAISVRSDTPLAGATLHAGDRDVPLERSSDGQTFRGLLGIDLESAP